MSIVDVDLSESSVAIPKSGPPKEMISVVREGGRTLVRINSSSLGVIQECMRKAQYLLHEKWTSENEAPATLFGSAIHKALEVFYRGEITERRMPKLEDMELMSYGHKVEGEESDLLLRATRAFVEKAQPLAALPVTDKRSLLSGMWILWNYYRSFIDDPFVAAVDEHGPIVEREFTYRIHEDDELIIDLFGTIDIVFQDVRNGHRTPGDHKTSSVLSSPNTGSYYDRERPNAQYTGYLIGAKEVLGIPGDEFIVNIIEVKPRPKTARGSAPQFPRQVTTRDANDYAEFREHLLVYVRNYLRAIETKMWPMGSTNICNLYSGCNYKAVCSAPLVTRETILRNKFVKGTK